MKKLLLLLVLSSISGTMFSDVRLPRFFADQVVLQREKPVNIWGWADPEEKVSIEFLEKKYHSQANSNGKWEIQLPSLPAGGPHTLTVTGNNTITLHDVYIGDVWICSGQSNMQYRVWQINAPDADIESPANAHLHFFQTKLSYSLEPEVDYPNGETWTAANRETIRNFSAAGYFFAKYLQPEINVPIGLIQISVGGSNVEAWIPKETVLLIPGQSERYEKAAAKGLATLKEDDKQSRMRQWEKNDKKGAMPDSYLFNAIPSCLYNGLIFPIQNLSVKGFLWYQGESNSSRGFEYRSSFAMLIDSWRKIFNQGNIPFIYVQLANYRKPCPQPCESDWAELREAQAYTLRLPKTGMATAIDIGDANDIHPKNKQDVGKRLALAALKVAYGKNIIASGPTYKSSKKKDNGIVLSFENVGKGLKTKDGDAPKEFSIATKDGDFVWANTKIIGKNQLFVWNDSIRNPEYVRYAWANNPSQVNTYNDVNLPMLPFRTDNRSINKKTK